MGSDSLAGQTVDQGVNETQTYSELKAPHLSHGSFLLMSEGTWEMSWMSPSVQQLSVIGNGGENISDSF